MPSADRPPTPWRETPLVHSATLSRAAGCRILLKLEAVQPSGSFKSRGVGNFVAHRVQEAIAKNGSSHEIHFWASSGGNAGLAAVHAARDLGQRCSIITPLTTKPFVIAKLKAAGADEVVQFGDSWKEADAHLREVIIPKDPSAVHVPPFDHPDIWQGNSTIIEELVDQTDVPPGMIVCSVGGGGLLNGVVLGLEKAGWDDVAVAALETKGADSLAYSLQRGELSTLPQITSQATSLGARQVSSKTFELAQRKTVKSVVLEDAEAAMGSWRFLDDERMMLELGCGVNLAMCYGGRLAKTWKEAKGRELTANDTVVIVVCGGSIVTLDMIHDWRKQFGWIEHVKLGERREDVPSDLTTV